jgi:flagellar biosynthetic protein FlhB
MSDTEEDQSDKPYEASKRKLEEARKKGEIVRSQDVVNLAVLATFLIGVFVVFGGVATGIVLDISRFVGNGVTRSGPLDGSQVLAAVSRWIFPLLGILFIVPFAIIAAGLVGTGQMLFTAEKLTFKLNRISLIANAKKKYGWSGLFEFAKNVAKFAVFASILAYLFFPNSARLFQINIVREIPWALANFYETSVLLLKITVVVYVIFAGMDALWQVKEHAKKNRMSHKELKDEHKNEEGDENIRQQRRAKAEDIATNRMLLDVPKATVIITNPTHYAVALQWSGGQDAVPKCVARGTDETARKIREIAINSGVPLYRDPPTARELYATVKIGMTIDRDHYKAVAIAIQYARRIQGMTRHA